MMCAVPTLMPTAAKVGRQQTVRSRAVRVAAKPAVRQFVASAFRTNVLSKGAVAKRASVAVRAQAPVKADEAPAVQEAPVAKSAVAKVVPAVLAAAACLVAAGPASATAATVVAADTAWILTSSALVLFMTIPGLGAFYAGLVKKSSMVSVLMQCFACCCMISVMWYTVGYSLCFGAGNGFIGDFSNVFLKNVTTASVNGTIPEALWVLFQMTFAIITPALMIGSFVERMKFNAVMTYFALWMFAVYFPACHMVWGDGLMAQLGVLDFAGGIVVHITAGIGALVGCIELGKRKENVMAVNNLMLTCLGTGMLWVGWYGFNGGSAVAAGSGAAFAALATQISAATAACVWLLQDIKESGKSSLLGMCTGSIAGLAAVTPAAGFISPLGALCIGAISGVVCRFFSFTVKEHFDYDDSLDVFGVHGVGGFVGTILLGIFGNPFFGGFNNVPMLTQTGIQIAAALATTLYTAVASYACLKLTGLICGGIRVPDEAEVGGVDEYSHGEMIYVEEPPVLPTVSQAAPVPAPATTNIPAN
eukprot:CAMPEP_0118921396 /NCGR_PEP_ID=MMETSP1169-20130426/696_1 /TAXON_ID=36882 /ORGANISM="Pyramimonas obovata, Strain CCMP722" /LENGTH=532 /DNA_ID=CAMNT_0006862111 /DNA_START=40 /DNA_END=1638 /DNA_ORIENTATION=+